MAYERKHIYAIASDTPAINQSWASRKLGCAPLNRRQPAAKIIPHVISAASDETRFVNRQCCTKVILNTIQTPPITASTMSAKSIFKCRSGIGGNELRFLFQAIAATATASSAIAKQGSRR